MTFEGVYCPGTVYVNNPTVELELAIYRELSCAGVTGAVRVSNRTSDGGHQLLVETRELEFPAFEAWTELIKHYVTRACDAIGAEYSLRAA
jgi:hypothetical protein